MTWKRALPYIAVAIASCALTIVVIWIVITVTAADYIVRGEVLKAKDPPLPKVRKPGSEEASITRVIDVTNLTNEQRARLDKFIDELKAEQIAE